MVTGGGLGLLRDPALPGASVRGFLAGVVRKKLGLNLVSDQTDKGRIYRIKEGSASPTGSDWAQQTA